MYRGRTCVSVLVSKITKGSFSGTIERQENHTIPDVTCHCGSPVYLLPTKDGLVSRSVHLTAQTPNVIQRVPSCSLDSAGKLFCQTKETASMYPVRTVAIVILVTRATLTRLEDAGTLMSVKQERTRVARIQTA